MPTKTDRELLAAWRETGDESAFAELVARHRQMVFRTSLRMLGSVQDTEDAVQAVFVVLAQKAERLQREGSLGGWLHTVTRHVAMQALARRASHTRQEKEFAMWAETDIEASSSDVDTSAVLRCLDQELAGLSAVLRQAVVLRYLQGNSEKAAAELAGCPLGTLSRRTSKGIAKLRQRLAKRGVALGGVALAGLLTSEASAAIPETLLPSILATVKTAVATTAAGTAATSTAGMLAKGAMKAMFIAKVKMVAAIAAAVTVAATVVVEAASGSGVMAGPAEAGNPGPVPSKVAAVTPVEKGVYVCVDLSAGPDATNYPVTQYANAQAIPGGVSNDVYKTTKLLMRLVPAGSFMMGSPKTERGRDENLETQHKVTLTKPFYIGIYEVTQRQWEQVMESNPSADTHLPDTGMRPVQSLIWQEITSFVGRIKARAGFATCDLPTEAQWEYACRAGTTGPHAGPVVKMAWCWYEGIINDAPGGFQQVVGRKMPNAWGLYDMHGNVMEWCLDTFDGDYPATNAIDPLLLTGAGSYDGKVIRDGSMGCDSESCRSATRGACPPDARTSNIGFRCIATR